MSLEGPVVTLTDRAASKVRGIIATESKQALRIAMVRTHCMGGRGFTFQLALEDSPEADGGVFEDNGVKVCIDPVPFFDREVVGLSMLAKMAAALFPDRDPVRIYAAGPARTLRKGPDGAGDRRLGRTDDGARQATGVRMTGEAVKFVRAVIGRYQRSGKPVLPSTVRAHLRALCQEIVRGADGWTRKARRRVERIPVAAGPAEGRGPRQRRRR